MKMNGDYRVSLVRPREWRTVIEEEFKWLASKAVPVAHSILSSMHNRHIGITPKLAAELAPLLLDPASAREPVGTWKVVLERLFKEAEWEAEITGDEDTGLEWERFAVLLCSVPPYSVMRLALPIIENACLAMGKCYLFCQEWVENGVSWNDYNKYAIELEREIINMARDKSDFFKIFWKDRSLALVNYSRRPSMWRGSGTGLPETAPSAVAMLLGLEPEIPESKRFSLHPKLVTDPQKHREIPRIKEGGFTGIHITRRIEDMGDMLMSEFLNPTEIMLDRLINTGYLALRRQPKREKLRDVMVVGVMPALVQPTLSADFAKACWFDFIARFSYQLYQKRLFRSEFRWIEGDAFDRMFNCNFLLQDLSEGDLFYEDESTPEYRWKFLMALGWMPHYLDIRRRFELIPGYRYVREEAQILDEDTRNMHAARQWAFAAWKAQRENKKWSLYERHRPLFGSPGKRKIEIEQFRFVHIMLFLPAPVKEENQSLLLSPAQHMGTLHKGFNLGYAPGRSASITWVPRVVEGSRQWAFHAGGRYDPLLFSGLDRRIKANQIAGKLEQAWRDQLEKEIWHG